MCHTLGKTQAAKKCLVGVTVLHTTAQIHTLLVSVNVKPWLYVLVHCWRSSYCMFSIGIAKHYLKQPF